MAAFKNGERKGVRAGVMIAMAKVLSDAEVKAAADYFAALKPTPGFNKVRRSRQGAGEPTSARAACGSRSPTAVIEPIGSRIIVLPQDAERAELRDPKSGFIDFVAEGQHRQGRGAGGRRRRQDASPAPSATARTLKGLGEVPGIAGRPATYIFRQLNDMKTGNRSGPWVELMKPVVAKLDAGRHDRACGVSSARSIRNG